MLDSSIKESQYETHSYNLNAETGYYHKQPGDEVFKNLPNKLRMIRNLNFGNNRPVYVLKESEIKNNSFAVPLFSTGYPSFFKGSCLEFTTQYKRVINFLLFHFHADFNSLTIYSFNRIEKQSDKALSETIQDALIKAIAPRIKQKLTI
jgi:hypothetical protein